MLCASGVGRGAGLGRGVGVGTVAAEASAITLSFMAEAGSRLQPELLNNERNKAFALIMRNKEYVVMRNVKNEHTSL
jgi:hypothetical protein